MCGLGGRVGQLAKKFLDPALVSLWRVGARVGSGVCGGVCGEEPAFGRGCSLLLLLELGIDGGYACGRALVLVLVEKLREETSWAMGDGDAKGMRWATEGDGDAKGMMWAAEGAKSVRDVRDVRSVEGGRVFLLRGRECTA